MNYQPTVIRGPDNYIRFLQKKFKTFDDAYWQELDDLEQKMSDLNIKLPNLNISEFTFVVEWLRGEVSANFVYEIFVGMDIDKVAQARVTRRLLNFSENKDDVIDMVRHVVKQLNEKVVPLYAAYLKLLKKYFEVISRIDGEHMEITWIEQVKSNKANSELKVYMDDMPLNQFINLIDTFRLQNIEDKFFIDENIVCFSEPGEGYASTHWVFAPKSQIDILKKVYNIKEKMTSMDKEYVTKLISGY